jgi:putative acetyltransferase
VIRGAVERVCIFQGAFGRLFSFRSCVDTLLAMALTIRPDDLTSADVQALVAEHLAGMHSHSPPGQVHALALQSLRAPEVRFWTAWTAAGELCGCGALKQLDAAKGEVKSMRTRAAFLRQGVGQAVLDEITRTARQRDYTQLLLETGTGPAFEPAHRLYMRNGFEWCGPFGDYVATEFNVFMVKPLRL